MLYSCAPDSSINSSIFSVDLIPPVIQSASQLDERRIKIVFDENIQVNMEETHINPPLTIESAVSNGAELVFTFTETQIIGEPYTMRIRVQDKAGNALSFLYEFNGWNPRRPALLINELNPKGSKSTPDCVELYATEDGNLGGLILTIGTETQLVDKFVFPAVEISSGDYIIVHTKSDGSDNEIDEHGPINVSGGRLASDIARDFWMRESPGLPGSNGAVVLYAYRNGPMMDAVLWSNRKDAKEDENLGWTAVAYGWAQEIGSQGHWMGNAEIPLPSEALNVELSTATRSLCRASIPSDTNSKKDWHIVPTRGQSFGKINTDESHIP